MGPPLVSPALQVLSPRGTSPGATTLLCTQACGRFAAASVMTLGLWSVRLLRKAENHPDAVMEGTNVIAHYRARCTCHEGCSGANPILQCPGMSPPAQPLSLLLLWTGLLGRASLEQDVLRNTRFVFPVLGNLLSCGWVPHLLLTGGCFM